MEYWGMGMVECMRRRDNMSKGKMRSKPKGKGFKIQDLVLFGAFCCGAKMSAFTRCLGFFLSFFVTLVLMTYLCMCALLGSQQHDLQAAPFLQAFPFDASITAVALFFSCLFLCL